LKPKLYCLARKDKTLLTTFKDPFVQVFLNSRKVDLITKRLPPVPIRCTCW